LTFNFVGAYRLNYRPVLHAQISRVDMQRFGISGTESRASGEIERVPVQAIFWARPVG